MNQKVVCFLMIIGVVITSACTPKSTTIGDQMPGIDLPMTEFNSKVAILSFPDNPSAYKNGDAPDFQIKNRSADAIIFPQDFGVKIYKKQGTLWEPIINKWGYPDGDNLLPTNNIYPPGLGLVVFPDVGVLMSSTTVRIVVIGHVKDRPTEQVGAFIDVQYIP